MKMIEPLIGTPFPPSQLYARNWYPRLVRLAKLLDLAPTKYMMLLGGLASCSSMEFSRYARVFQASKTIRCVCCPNYREGNVCEENMETCQSVYRGLNKRLWNE